MIFDRQLVTAHRNRQATSYQKHAFLKNRVAHDLANRLKHIRRTFQLCVDLGCHTGQLSSALKDIYPNNLICTDLSGAMVNQVPSSLKIVLDEEALPFSQNSIDLIISALSLQWVNDMPGVLAQIYTCLKPDGLFLASLFGGDTLIELRDCFSTAELELRGGITPRLSPMIAIKEAGALLQRIGFALPVADQDRIRVTYPNPLTLLHDLRHMGETNALYSRSQAFMPRSLITRAFELYQKRYGLADGRIYATFDVITLTGWKPHKSQPKPLARGTAKVNLNDFL
jgi:malonyl-ACP O-methyltransferase BioC